MGSPKLQLFTEQLLMRKTRIEQEKKNLQVIYKEEIMRHIGGVRSKFPAGQPTNERLTAIVEVFPKKQWF